MNPRWIALILASLLLSAPVAARQQPEELVNVLLRVTAAAQGGGAVVDRGTSDGLAEGDRVVFHPRAGGAPTGTVAKADERSAVVALDDPGLTLAPGTRGEALIPRSRLRAAAKPKPAAPPPAEPAPAAPPAETPAPDAPQEEPAVPPAWSRADDEWTPDQPLLAQVRAVRPEERALRVTGRLYLSADQIWTTEDERSDTFVRLGTGLFFENLFGKGGGLHFDGETNYRDTTVPDDEDDDGFELRLDRLSYYRGGTRFDRERWEAGRFLLDGMPEFGVVDGFEYNYRLRGGHRVGGSLGFMPEPDHDYDTGEDFQVSGYYRWVADDSERLTAGGGYQKTFHDGDADRDLLIGKFQYLPPQGWSVQATAWIDLYTSGDDAKGSGPELTQAYATTGRAWRNGNELHVTYTHLAFPEIDREEFRPVNDDQLADDHNERLAVDGLLTLGQAARLLGEIGGWTDEDESGGDAQLGFEVDGVILDESRLRFIAFGTDGEFSSVIGGRVGYGSSTRNGRWDLLYELSNNDQKGFNGNNDDIIMQWLRASYDLHLRSGWDLSFYADTRDWEDEASWSTGLYVQKTF